MHSLSFKNVSNGHLCAHDSTVLTIPEPSELIAECISLMPPQAMTQSIVIILLR